MPAYRDLTGDRFGRLTVLGRAPDEYTKSGVKKITYNCKCDCGNEKSVSGRGLRTGDTKSCGCLKDEVGKKSGERLGNTYGGMNRLPDSSLRHLYSKYKGSAKKRRKEFDVPFEEFREIVSKDCYYCGVKPLQTEGAGKSKMLYNGVDRVDNTKGYVSGNMVPCCKHCNVMKGTMSLPTFIEKMKTVLSRLSLNN
jgi:hypothetical protein